MRATAAVLLGCVAAGLSLGYVVVARFPLPMGPGLISAFGAGLGIAAVIIGEMQMEWVDA